MRQPMNLNYPNSHSGKMVRNNLRSIQIITHGLHELLQDADDLPDWVLSKVSVALDRLSVAENYLRAKIQGKLLMPNGKLEQVEKWMLVRAKDGGKEAAHLVHKYI